MNDKTFLDTNVFVYAFDHGSPEKLRIARKLIAEGAASRFAVVSYQVVQEFVNVALPRFQAAMNESELEEFLFESMFPMTAITSSSSLVIEALRLRNRRHFSWYDSLIVAAAIQSGCKILYSEDLQHGQRFGDLVVQNPFL